MPTRFRLNLARQLSKVKTMAARQHEHFFVSLFCRGLLINPNNKEMVCKCVFVRKGAELSTPTTFLSVEQVDRGFELQNVNRNANDLLCLTPSSVVGFYFFPRIDVKCGLTGVGQLLLVRSLIAMATDEVGVELGVDTVERCRTSLLEAEAQASFFFCFPELQEEAEFLRVDSVQV